MSITSGPTVPDRIGYSLPFSPIVRLALSAMSVSLPGHLVRDPGEAFIAPEQGQHIENPRRGRPSGERRAQRLRHLAELYTASLRHLPHGLLRRLGAPAVEPGKGLVHEGEQFPRLAL